MQSKKEVDPSVESHVPKKKPKFPSMASTLERVESTIVSAPVPQESMSKRTHDPFSLIKSAVMRHDSGMEKVHSFLLAHSQQASEAAYGHQNANIASQQDPLPLQETDGRSSMAASALLENQFDQLDHFINSNDALFMMKENEFSAHHPTEALSSPHRRAVSNLPFDWNLKTQLTVLSPLPFSWLKHQHESEPSSLFHFTQSRFDKDACSPAISMQQCLYYWMFPFEAAALSSISYETILATVKGSRGDTMDPTLWFVSGCGMHVSHTLCAFRQSALDSAFAQLSVEDGHVQYFYLIHGDLNAVFIASPGCELEVRLRAQDRRHLKLLEDKSKESLPHPRQSLSHLWFLGLIKMEDFAKTETLSMAEHSSTEESLQVLKELEELESLAPGSTRIHHASPLFSQQKSRQYDSIGANESPIHLKGKEKVTCLYQFLKEMLKHSVVTPVIVSHRPFLNATLKKSQMKVHRSVKRITPSQDGLGYKEESIHKMSIEGLVLPSSLASLFMILKALQKGELEADVVSEPNSAGLNMGSRTEEGPSEEEIPKSLYYSKIAMREGQWMPTFADFCKQK